MNKQEQAVVRAAMRWYRVAVNPCSFQSKIQATHDKLMEVCAALAQRKK